jgi:hypothetical protein
MTAFKIGDRIRTLDGGNRTGVIIEISKLDIPETRYRIKWDSNRPRTWYRQSALAIAPVQEKIS